MSEPRTGRELTPREEGDLTPIAGGDQHAVERFSAGPRAHAVALTEERSAQVVRQSGNARNVAFLAVLVLALLIPVYWFYDLGIPALGNTGRLQNEKGVQYVTDVSRGYALYLANCARCHSSKADPGDGKGGIGPPLNDQAKLYNVLQANGQPGTGHLNPTYLKNVLTSGGRYVCGDANSVMPVWAQPGGPLNYRQIEELIAWLDASSDTKFEYKPPVNELAAGPKPTPVEVSGWRDPNYQPAPGAPTPPACWRNPSGTIGGGGGATASAAPVGTPGTVDNPRVIKLQETAALQITDPSGTQVSSITVKAGETITFEVENVAGYDHNFYVGAKDDLASNNVANLTGIPAFASGTQTYTWTVPASGSFQFACTLAGHYQTMHGDFVIQP